LDCLREMIKLKKNLIRLAQKKNPGLARLKDFISELDSAGCFAIRSRNHGLPRISIVTPSFNQGRFLERTILSVINQNYPNLEYIIIDGGSTDGSREIIKKYVNYLTYWTSRKDGGQSEAINNGFKRSTGDVLAWLNSDDVYLPGTLNAVGRLFEADRLTGVFYGNLVHIDEHDNLINMIKDIPFNKRAFLYWGNDINQSAAFFRRTPFFEIDMLREHLHYGMDYDLWFRMIRADVKFVYVPSLLAAARIHSGAKTVQDSKSARCAILSLKAEILNIRENDPYSGFCRSIYRVKRFVRFALNGDVFYLFWVSLNHLSGFWRKLCRFLE
jgi:glycosyltransferase involved in cell wall biosynthesis